MKTIAKNSSNIISKLILGLIMVGCSFTTTAQAEVLEAPSDQAQIESASNETHIYPEEKELLSIYEQMQRFPRKSKQAATTELL
jgi:hypothetical protein